MTTGIHPGLSENDIAQLVRDRREFHAHPELRYGELRTAEAIAARLTEYGYQVTRNVGRTGVVGSLAGTAETPEGHSKALSRTLLYRADMDALPIHEENDVDYRSETDGVMHACGHDAHIAIGLAVARRMAAERNLIRGHLKFAFQPAEEGGNGAVAMIEDGVLASPQVDAAIGLHVWNSFRAGTVGIYAGPMMAACDEFDLAIVGRGGHGAMPQETIDSIVVAAQVVTALQTIVSRNTSPLDAAVVTVGQINGGTAFNIIAEAVHMRGTVRSFSKETYTKLPGLFERVVRGVVESMGATYTLTYRRQTPPLVNDAAVCEMVAECAAEVVGREQVIRDDSVRTMGSEDMSYFLEKVPGCYFFLGTRNEERGLIHPHHSPRFDIDESAMAAGVDIMTRVIKRYLS